MMFLSCASSSIERVHLFTVLHVSAFISFGARGNTCWMALNRDGIDKRKKKFEELCSTHLSDRTPHLHTTVVVKRLLLVRQVSDNLALNAEIPCNNFCRQLQTTGDGRTGYRNIAQSFVLEVDCVFFTHCSCSGSVLGRSILPKFSNPNGGE